VDDKRHGGFLVRKEHSQGHGHGEHSQTCGHHLSGSSERAVFFGFLITFLYMLVEFLGGYLSGSLALTTDAIHMLADVGALLSAWAGFYFGRLPRSPRKTFGYQRFEILASLSNSFFLLILVVFVAYEALERLSRPVEIMAMPMFIVSLVGLAVNCLVFYVLNGGEREHLNIQGAILHVIGDLLGSVAAVLAAIVVYFTGWTPIDSILSIFACLLVLNSALKLFLGSLNILMEGAPPHIDVAKVERTLREVPNVRGLRLHVWEITSGKPMAMVNLDIREEEKALETIRTVKSILENDFALGQSVVGIGSGECGVD
jgi:cobalt-zinc-cadmium efflux system protein